MGKLCNVLEPQYSCPESEDYNAKRLNERNVSEVGSEDHTLINMFPFLSACQGPDDCP